MDLKALKLDELLAQFGHLLAVIAELLDNPGMFAVLTAFVSGQPLHIRPISDKLPVKLLQYRRYLQLSFPGENRLFSIQGLG